MFIHNPLWKLWNKTNPRRQGVQAWQQSHLHGEPSPLHSDKWEHPGDDAPLTAPLKSYIVVWQTAVLFWHCTKYKLGCLLSFLTFIIIPVIHVKTLECLRRFTCYRNTPGCVIDRCDIHFTFSFMQFHISSFCIFLFSTDPKTLYAYLETEIFFFLTNFSFMNICMLNLSVFTKLIYLAYTCGG